MKILFFRLGAIGDVLLTTAAVKKAKELFPGAEIHYLTEEKAAPVLYGNPYIDRIIPLRQVKHFLPRDFGIFYVAGFLRQHFSGVKYDYFFDLESSYYSVYVSFFIKAVKKLGFKISRKKRGLYNLFYDRRLDYAEKDRYIAYRYLALINEASNFTDADPSPVLKVTPEEKTAAAAFYEKYSVKPGDFVVLFGVSGTWPTKKWPDINWVGLARALTEKMDNARVFVLWGPGDPKELLDVLDVIERVNVIPDVGLRELITIISGGNLLVANDGAPRHIAQALGLKTIGLFGPTNEKGWARPDDNNIVLTADAACRPCDRLKCEKDGCMSLIRPGRVLESLLALSGEKVS